MCIYKPFHVSIKPALISADYSLVCESERVAPASAPLTCRSKGCAAHPSTPTALSETRAALLYRLTVTPFIDSSIYPLYIYITYIYLSYKRKITAEAIRLTGSCF